MRFVSLSTGQQLTRDDLRREGALPREVMEAAEGIVRAVREGGDRAVRDSA